MTTPEPEITGETAADPLADARDHLTARGYAWHYIGKPTVMPDGQTRYWFNGSQYGRENHRAILAKQPFGWFTLAELLAEKFTDGLRIDSSPPPLTGRPTNKENNDG